MSAPTSVRSRVLAFNLVGVAGLGVQMLALFVLVHALRLPVVVATIVSVEAAVVHNFLWHTAWTWRDRIGGAGAILSCFLRFNLTNGAVSIVVNGALMAGLHDGLGLHYLLASPACVACGSVANFLLGDRVVFPRGDTLCRVAANSTTVR